LVEAAATEGAAPAELETKEQARALGPASKSQDKK